MKPTPGTWEINTEAGRPYREVFSGDQLICDCGVGGVEEVEANTRLIAAAPELLQALIHLSNEVFASTGMAEINLRRVLGSTNFNCLLQRASEARLAISKAEGQ